MEQISRKREHILSFIKEFVAKNGYSPSIREIMNAVGLRSTSTVHYHLQELERTGKINLQGGKNRAISLSDPHGIPVVGTVAAGYPILAIENIDDYLPWQDDHGCFALRVKGDSMIEARIFDGDKVIVRPQQTADHGDIVVAMIGDEATVKRLSKKNGQVWLLPENPAYSPIDGKNATILGKVCAVVRIF